jgi:hypothetical protein
VHAPGAPDHPGASKRRRLVRRWHSVATPDAYAYAWAYADSCVRIAVEIEVAAILARSDLSGCRKGEDAAMNKKKILDFRQRKAVPVWTRLGAEGLLMS